MSGFYNGVTGLVTQPYSEMQRAGGKGLAKGVAKGIGGVFLKPPAGTFPPFPSIFNPGEREKEKEKMADD